MLVPSMNNEEIYKEIMLEYNGAMSHLNKVAENYNRERNKFKIKKEKTYVKVYKHKTKRENYALFILQKSLSVERYKESSHISVTIVMYYFTEKGIRAVRINPEELKFVYNAHFFTRYNERLNLGLEEPLDKMIHFFTYNVQSVGQIDEFNEYSGVSKDGVRLGEWQPPLVIVKTFITNEQMKDQQQVLQEKLLAHFTTKMEAEIKKDELDKDLYAHMADALKGIGVKGKLV